MRRRPSSWEEEATPLTLAGMRSPVVGWLLGRCTPRICLCPVAWLCGAAAAAAHVQPRGRTLAGVEKRLSTQRWASADCSLSQERSMKG